MSRYRPQEMIMPELKINYGVNRKEPGKKKIEHKNGRLTIWGNWAEESTHETIKMRIRADHPGWLITGYAWARWPDEVIVMPDWESAE